ncbi:MAG: HlyC/CorC family transporter [Chloroflexaceae bacterium]|nr:HlyC/CorC family transporter [Chloroflexaceae bacterium]
MTAIALKIFFILILMVINGVFSGSEIAVVSARKIRLEQLAHNGDRQALLALKLAKSPSNFLSTVQIGITLIGILSGALGGATLSQRLEKAIALVPGLANYSEAVAFVVVVSGITYLSLVIGELVPKRLALNNPEGIARRVAGPMRQLSKLVAPLVYLLSASTDGLLRLLGIRSFQEAPIAEEEIRALIRQGVQAGVFEETEHNILQRVFRLDDRPVRSLMTPRTAIAWLDIEAPLEETQREILAYNHGRFPVCRGDLDNCLGILPVKTLLNAIFNGEPMDLQGGLQTPLYVYENTSALRVLETFKETGIYIALVTDEFGGIEGLVTIGDLMEAIVGELPSDGDREEPRIIQREDGSWLLDGMVSADELRELFAKDSLPMEREAHYQTLAGLVIAMLGKIPTSGEHFEWENLRFEVVDMDGMRIDKVLVSQFRPAVTEDNRDREDDE